MGPTQSTKTGPKNAIDGNYYIYVDATGRNQDDKAGYVSCYLISSSYRSSCCSCSVILVKDDCVL